MEKLAYLSKEYKDSDKRKFFFSNQPTNDEIKIGNSFLTLLLECIWVWSKWFPVDPD